MHRPEKVGLLCVASAEEGGALALKALPLPTPLEGLTNLTDGGVALHGCLEGGAGCSHSVKAKALSVHIFLLAGIVLL